MNRNTNALVAGLCFWVAWILVWAMVAGCSPPPEALEAAAIEGDYQGAPDADGCVVTVGLHAGGEYTTGRVCPDGGVQFPGRWVLEGSTVHVTASPSISTLGVRQPDVAYDLQWDGEVLTDAAGLVYSKP